MANDDRPQSLRADDFTLISTSEEIILRSLASHEQVRLDNEDGDLLDLNAANAGAGASTDTRTDIQFDGAAVVEDAVSLNLTGSAVADVVDAGDGAVTATITDTNTNTDTLPSLSEDGVQVLAAMGGLNLAGSGVADVTDNGNGTVTVTITDTNTQIPDTHLDVLRDGAVVQADAAGVNLTGSAVADVTSDAEGTVTVTLTDTNTQAGDTHLDVLRDGAVVQADATSLNLTGSAVADATADAEGNVTATLNDTNTDTDTHAAVSDDGGQVLADPAGIDFGANLDVTDNGDETVTVDAAGGGGDTEPEPEKATHHFSSSPIPDADAAVMRLFVPSEQTLTVYRGGLQDDAGAVPAGLDLRVRNDTDATEAHRFTSKYADPDPNPTIAGGTDGADATFELQNATGAEVNASGWLEYSLAPTPVGEMLTDGGIARYSMDSSDISDGIVTDSWGSYDGTISGNPTTGVAGVTNEAVEFDGTGDVISLPNFPALSAYTISFWAYTTSDSENNRDALTLGDQNYVSFSYNTGGYNPSHGGNDGVWLYDNDESLDGSWSNLCMTWDGGTVRFYVNGSVVDSASISSMPSQGRDTTIGSNGSGGRFFDGAIDEVRIYDRALSAAEVTRLYELGGGA